MTTKLNKTAEQIRDEALDLLCDCAGQFLIETDDGTLTHSFMSTEERLCAFLVENGRMEKVGRLKFRLLPAGSEIDRLVGQSICPVCNKPIEEGNMSSTGYIDYCKECNLVQ